MPRFSVVGALVLGAMAAGCAGDLLVGPDRGPPEERSRKPIFLALETVAETAGKIHQQCPGRIEIALQSMIEAMNGAPERAGRTPTVVPPGSKVMTYLETYAELVAHTPEMPPRRVMWLGADALARGVDSHSRFILLDQLRRAGKPSVGLLLDRDAGGISVREVDAASPAATAGVRIGDHLVSVDDEATALMHADDAQGLLFGDEGTTVKLAIERNGQMLDFNLLRARYEKGVTAKVKDGVLVLSVPNFKEGVAKKVTSLIDDASRTNPRPLGYVIDLRQNLGGLLDEVAALADVFIGDGVLFTQAPARGCAQTSFSGDTRRAKAGDATHGASIVLLIDRGTESGAEMFAAAMMESGRARSVGQDTLGFGRVQTVFPLITASGGALKVTTSELVTAGGRYIDGNGVAPTLEISSDEDALSRAVALILAR